MELLACCDAFIGSCVASPPHQPVLSTRLACTSSSQPTSQRNPSRVTLWNAVVEKHLLARRAYFNAALGVCFEPALLHAALAISGFSPLLPAPFASRVSEIDNALPWQLCSFGFNVLGMCLFMRRWQTQATRLCCQRYLRLVHVRSRQRRPSMAAVFFRIQCAIALILASSTIPITKSYTYLQTQTPTSGGLFAKQRVPAGFTYRQGHNRVAAQRGFGGWPPYKSFLTSSSVAPQHITLPPS